MYKRTVIFALWASRRTPPRGSAARRGSRDSDGEHPRVMHRLGRLDPATTVFLCCDVQEAFRSAIHRFPAVISTAQRMLAAARTLSIPVAVTEQYPKGLKPTVAELDIRSCLKVRAAQALRCRARSGRGEACDEAQTHIYQDLHRFPMRQNDFFRGIPRSTVPRPRPRVKCSSSDPATSLRPSAVAFGRWKRRASPCSHPR
jgi:hypothetical protein